MREADALNASDIASQKRQQLAERLEEVSQTLRQEQELRENLAAEASVKAARLARLEGTINLKHKKSDVVHEFFRVKYNRYHDRYVDRQNSIESLSRLISIKVSIRSKKPLFIMQPDLYRLKAKLCRAACLIQKES